MPFPAEAEKGEDRGCQEEGWKDHPLNKAGGIPRCGCKVHGGKWPWEVSAGGGRRGKVPEACNPAEGVLRQAQVRRKNGIYIWGTV